MTIAVLPSRLIAGTATESIRAQRRAAAERRAELHRPARVLDLERRVLEPEPLAPAAPRAARGSRGSRRPGRRARARRATGKPLVSVQTCRSCTSTTLGLGDDRAPDGVRLDVCRATTSRKMRVDSRSSPNAPQNMSAATRRPAIGSKRSQPVASTSAPATAVPTNAARSVATCRNAPRTFRLSRLARASSAVATRLTAIPASATTRTIPPCTSPAKPAGESPPNTIQMPTSRSSRPFACAERISSRRKPYVHRPCAGRAAIVAATSANAERGDVGDQVPGVGEQRERAGEDPGDELADHQRRDQRERGEQQPAIAVRRWPWSCVCICHRLTSAREGASTLPR